MWNFISSSLETYLYYARNDVDNMVMIWDGSSEQVWRKAALLTNEYQIRDCWQYK